MENDFVIQTDCLTKSFKDLKAVDEVSLKVKGGELFGLLGVNGAGKTTLIRILCGLLKPTSGKASVLGKDVESQMVEIKRYIAVSPQETSVAPNLTVEENLCFFASIYGFDGKRAKARAGEIIDKMGLAEVAKKRAKVLSGGWQRRLSIALALISDPKIIFLDEPTLGLDVLARRELWRIIEGLKGKCTVVLTSHYLEEIEHLCDRGAILAKGRLLTVGTKEQILKEAEETDFENAFVKIVEGAQL